MVYKFDPEYFDGTVFELDDTSRMAEGWMEFIPQNLPIPASYFPKSLTFNKARAALPDIFHTSRNLIVFSDRARNVMEHWAPGQVEFIPVACHAKPKIAATLASTALTTSSTCSVAPSGCNGARCHHVRLRREMMGRSFLGCYMTSTSGSCVTAPLGSL
jgi:hypothetical protein